MCGEINLILHEYTLLHYIKKKGIQQEPQQESNPSLLRGSQALKPLRYNALLEKGPNKRVYTTL